MYVFFYFLFFLGNPILLCDKFMAFTGLNADKGKISNRVTC